jgi:O-antigen ligase
LRSGVLYLSLAALTWGIFMLGSRTGWLMAILGLPAILFRYRQLLRRKETAWALLSISCVMVALFVFLPAKHRELMNKNLISTVAEGRDGSGNQRLRAMGDALAAARETHGLGTGVGGSFFHYLERHPRHNSQYVVTLGGENIMSIWGQILAESGIPGTLLFLLFTLSFWRLAWRHTQRRPGPRATAILVSSVLVLGFAAHLVGNVARSDIWPWFALWVARAKES